MLKIAKGLEGKASLRARSTSLSVALRMVLTSRPWALMFSVDNALWLYVILLYLLSDVFNKPLETWALTAARPVVVENPAGALARS